MKIPEEHQSRILEEDTPEWIIHHTPPNPPENRHEAVDSVLLLDGQRNLESNIFYRRIVRHLPTLASVQYGSRIEMEFSPETEILIIHSIQIQRGHEAIELRPMQDVRVLNRETQMERFVFNGRLLAVLTLNDIQAGDIVDYSYSLRQAREPLLLQRSGRFMLRSNFNAKSVRYRLLYQPQRTIYAQAHQSELQPEASYTPDGLVDCRWSLGDATIVQSEQDTPIWALPLCWIDYGEFSTWEEVANAISPLFAPSNHTLPAAIAERMKQLRSASTSEEHYIVQIIRYVQEHIRYVAIAIDDHTLKPYEIPIILERHYGDCKDKSFLLCRLLKEAGFEAVPALVNTALLNRAMEGLPTPNAFNHAIVRLRHGDRYYWIDPTLVDQGGTLDNIFVPHYGLALVLNSPGEGQREIPPAAPDSISYDELIKAHQTDGMAELRITRTLTGSIADHMRHRISSVGLAEIDRLLVNDYQKAYRDASLYSTTEYEDNRDENRIYLVHTLQLGGIWAPVDARGAINQARFPVFGLQGVLRLPENLKRTTPYPTWHPLLLRASLEVRLTTGYKLGRNQGIIQSPSFRCKYFLETTGNSGRITCEYASLSDHVSVRSMADHAKAVRQLAQIAVFNVRAPQRNISRGFSTPPRRR